MMTHNRDNLRIAIADDDPLILAFFNEFLSREGHRVVALCADGIELVRACSVYRPDLVITDLKMPRMGGIEAIVAVQRTFAVPVIVVTAAIDTEEVDKAVGEHVMAYLRKPISRALLAPVINAAMAQFDGLCREHRLERRQRRRTTSPNHTPMP